MAGILKLVERQMAMWDLKRRLADIALRPGRCLEDGVAYGPCLFVSRECGSGGGTIARIAAEQLGWHLFDREVLERIADLAEVRMRLYDSADEQARLTWGDNGEVQAAVEELGYEKYLRYLRQVILALGHQGDVVILGRGAQHLVPAQCSLRLRVVAPFSLRVQRIAESNKLSFDQAQTRVRHVDESRAEFIRKAFHEDSASPLNYDLIVNTGNISLNGAAELVLFSMNDKLGVQPRKGSLKSPPRKPAPEPDKPERSYARDYSEGIKR